MNSERRSIFAFPAGRRSKWVVFLVWLVAIFLSFGTNLPGKFTDAEDNESTSFLPGDAESTKVLSKAERLQGGELAPAVFVYRRQGGLSDADRQKISEDAGRLTEKRFPAVVADGSTAASGGSSTGGEAPSGGAQAGNLPEGCAGPTTPVPGQPSDYAPFVGPICSEDGQAAIVTAYLKATVTPSARETVQFGATPRRSWRWPRVKSTGGAACADASRCSRTSRPLLLLRR